MFFLFVRAEIEPLDLVNWDYSTMCMLTLFFILENF